MTTSDLKLLCCQAIGCVYSVDPGTMDLFCAAHWDMVGPELKKLLRNELERYGTSPRWMALARLAAETVAREEGLRALAEERGYFPRPKFEVRRVA